MSNDRYHMIMSFYFLDTWDCTRGKLEMGNFNLKILIKRHKKYLREKWPIWSIFYLSQYRSRSALEALVKPAWHCWLIHSDTILFWKFTGRMSPVSQSEQTSGILQIQRHCSSCLQCPGIPQRPKLVIGLYFLMSILPWWQRINF